MVGFIEMFGYWFVSIVFDVAPVSVHPLSDRVACFSNIDCFRAKIA